MSNEKTTPQPQASISVQDNTPHATRVSETSLAPKREGVLATARDRNGIVPQVLTPDTLITVGNVHAPLRAMEAAGVVRRNGSGEYEEVPQAERAAKDAQATTERQEAEKTKGFEVALKPETSEFVSQVVGSQKANGRDANSLAVQFFKDPNALVADLMRAGVTKSKSGGMASEQEVRGYLHNVVLEHREQASALFRKAGFDPEEVWSFVDKTIPEPQANAGYLRHFHGDTSFYRYVLDKFQESRGGGSKAPEGVEVFTVQSGKMAGTRYVQLPGYPPMRIETARRMGLFKGI